MKGGALYFIVQSIYCVGSYPMYEMSTPNLAHSYCGVYKKVVHGKKYVSKPRIRYTPRVYVHLAKVIRTKEMF